MPALRRWMPSPTLRSAIPSTRCASRTSRTWCCRMCAWATCGRCIKPSRRLASPRPMLGSSPTSLPARASTIVHSPTRARSRSPSASRNGWPRARTRSATSRSRSRAASTPAAITTSATSASWGWKSAARSTTSCCSAGRARRMPLWLPSPAPALTRRVLWTPWRRSWRGIWSSAPAPRSRSSPPTTASATPPSRRRSMPPDEVRPLAQDLATTHSGGGEGADAVASTERGERSVQATSGAADPDGPIWHGNAFHADAWSKLAEGEAIPNIPVILSKARWLAERGGLAGRNAPLGLQLDPGEALEDIAADLPLFAMIALSFPKFGDGRAFSTATLLRERYRFAGELRAVGNVLSDQIPYMRRVGFDSFEVTHGPTRRALAEGRIAEVKLHYQPAAAHEAPAGTRPWLRRS